MSGLFSKLLPILKDPKTWSAVIGIVLGVVGMFFGAPHLAPAPTVTLPQTLSVKPMAIFKIPVAHTGSTLELIHDCPNGDIFGPLPDGSYRGQFQLKEGEKQGTFHLSALSVSRFGKLAHDSMTVQVGDSPNPPGPNPPNPPGPADPFVQAIQNAYAQETDPAKAQHVLQLAGIYQAIGGKVVSDSGLNTLADLFDYLHTAIENLNMPAGALSNVRKYIGNDMNSVIGTQANAPLDAALRQKAAAEFSKIGNALAEMK